MSECFFNPHDGNPKGFRKLREKKNFLTGLRPVNPFYLLSNLLQFTGKRETQGQGGETLWQSLPPVSKLLNFVHRGIEVCVCVGCMHKANLGVEVKKDHVLSSPSSIHESSANSVSSHLMIIYTKLLH